MTKNSKTPSNTSNSQDATVPNSIEELIPEDKPESDIVALGFRVNKDVAAFVDSLVDEDIDTIKNKTRVLQVLLQTAMENYEVSIKSHFIKNALAPRKNALMEELAKIEEQLKNA